MSPRSRPRSVALVLALLAPCILAPPCFGPPRLEAPPAEALAGEQVPQQAVRGVLERRCVVCHGCYDAPCQLLLSSPEGLERGSSKSVVYQADRLLPASPTRLFVDAHDVEAWRARDFFPVLPAPGEDPIGALLPRMLVLGRAHVFAPGERLPDALPLGIGRELSCPTADEFDDYAREHPMGGMPYGMAPLPDGELETLARWALQGAHSPPEPPALPASAEVQRAGWERFLNGGSLKERITARYLFEHWVFAHLYFEDLPEGPFFRIVRSRTAPGEAIDVIATRLPHGDPGGEFWYRLEPIRSTLVHKTHIVYPLGAARMQRLTQLFLESDWEPTRLPSYALPEASNPFLTFDPIPARSRYQFLLDDAQTFVMTFIRGPVCHGQVAVDVIEDRFFAAFLDPDVDPSVVDRDFLKQAANLLSLPGEHGNRPTLRGLGIEYDRKQAEYMTLRERHYERVDPEGLGPTLADLWDGDGHDPDALLTIFRHFDNASVVRGFVGAMPETAWVIDFPIFERIYYDLVANFDVFGNAFHQLATRLYMDHLRMQSEDLFLTFLPPDRRVPIRNSWYVGAESLQGERATGALNTGHATRVPFRSDDPVSELLERLLARSAAVAGEPDLLNRCTAPPCDRPGATHLERRAERALQPLAGVRGPWVAPLPELAFLRVRAGESRRGAVLYSLVHDKAHTNVASLFDEEERREPEQDTLTILRGSVGSYPNFLFDVDVAEIESFTRALMGVRDAGSLEAVVARFGVRRSSPAFWSAFDWVHDDFRRRRPTRAGLFDLNRYENL